LPFASWVRYARCRCRRTCAHSGSSRLTQMCRMRPHVIGPGVIARRLQIELDALPKCWRVEFDQPVVVLSKRSDYRDRTARTPSWTVDLTPGTLAQLKLIPSLFGPNTGNLRRRFRSTIWSAKRTSPRMVEAFIKCLPCKARRRRPCSDDASLDYMRGVPCGIVGS